MNHQRDGKKISHVLKIRRSKGEDSTDTTCRMTDGDRWSSKQQQWKSVLGKRAELVLNNQSYGMTRACHNKISQPILNLATRGNENNKLKISNDQELMQTEPKSRL